MTEVDPIKLEHALAELLEKPHSEQSAAIARLGADDAALARALQRLLDVQRRSGDLLAPPEAGLAALGADPMADGLIGRTLGDFTLVELIATGGMGRVYLGRQHNPDRPVAVKVLSTRHSRTSTLRRFAQEGEVLGTLSHPGICRVLHAGSASVDGVTTPYLAMDFVDGRPLTIVAAALSIAQRLELMVSVCDAVEYAHRRGVIHRDLKPANVLVERPPDGPARPKVVDFGLAALIGEEQHTLTQDASAILGTIQYMSPERLAGASAMPDTRWDVYALGVMLFEVLAGVPPFGSCKDSSAVARILAAPASPSLARACPGIHRELDLIVGKAMARSIEERYASPAALAEDLRAHLARRPISAHPPGAWYRLRKFVQRERGLTVGVILAVLAALGGAGATLYGFARAVERRDEARAALEVGRVSQYIANVHSAAASLRAGDVQNARSSLEAAPEDLRGVEWRLIRAELEQSSRTIKLPPKAGSRGSPRIAIPPPGGRLACVDGGTLYVVETATGRARSADIDLGPDATFESVAWSPRHSKLYLSTSGERPTLLVADPETLKVERIVEISSVPGGLELALDREEQHLVIAGSRWVEDVPRGILQVRDAATLELRFEDADRACELRAFPTSLESTLILLRIDDRVELFNWRTGEARDVPIATDSGGQFRNHVAVSRDGSRFAVGSILSTQVWSLDPLAQIVGFGATPGVSWHRLVFSADGERLYAAQNARLSAWDLRTGAVVARATLSTTRFQSSIAVDDSTREVFIASEPGTIRVIPDRFVSGPAQTRAREGSALSPDFSSLARLATGLPGTPVTLSIVDPLSGAVRQELAASPEGADILRVCWSPDGRFLAAAHTRPGTEVHGLSVFDFQRGQRHDVPCEAPNSRYAEFSPDSSRIVYAAGLHRWVVAAAGTLETLGEFTEDPRARIHSVSHLPGGDAVALGMKVFDSDGAARGVVAIRRTADGAVIADMPVDPGPGAESGLHVACSPDGRWIAASSGRRVELIDVAARRNVSGIALQCPQPGLAWHPDSTRLYAGSFDATIRILGVMNLRHAGEAHHRTHLTELFALKGDSWMSRPMVSADGTRIGCITVYPANRCFVWDTLPPAERAAQPVSSPQ